MKAFENKYGLDISQLAELHSLYEASCTAQYVMENYNIEEEKAMEIGYEVRRLMDKYGFEEDNAIDEVLEGMEI